MVKGKRSLPRMPKPKSKRFKYRQRCPYKEVCGYRWWSMVRHPKECPRCKRRLDAPAAKKG